MWNLSLLSIGVSGKCCRSSLRVVLELTFSDLFLRGQMSHGSSGISQAQRPKKTYKSSFSINLSCCRLCRGRETGVVFLSLFFLIRANLFQSFRPKFSSSFYAILLALKLWISYFLSANSNPELPMCIICTGVTLLAALHLNCTTLSQSESSNF